MNAKLMELAGRRTSLVAMAATQRLELSQALAPWHEALAVMDRGLVTVHFITSYAPLLAGVAAFMVPVGPRRVGKWLRRALLVWSMARVVKRILPR